MQQGPHSTTLGLKLPLPRPSCYILCTKPAAAAGARPADGGRVPKKVRRVERPPTRPRRPHSGSRAPRGLEGRRVRVPGPRGRRRGPPFMRIYRCGDSQKRILPTTTFARPPHHTTSGARALAPHFTADTCWRLISRPILRTTPFGRVSTPGSDHHATDRLVKLDRYRLHVKSFCLFVWFKFVKLKLFVCLFLRVVELMFRSLPC